MIGYAQTNIQLYNQLRELGYPPRDLERIHRAHALAMRLFTGAYRGSGRPFLAHLVGTASVLAWLRTPIAVVAGGLLHSAYSHGEFGNFWRGMTDDKRRRVREAVGAEAEELVAGYTRLPWTAATVASLASLAGSLTEPERAVLLVRLANEVDDHQDQNLLYVTAAGHRREFIWTTLHRCPGIAERLGYPALAGELTRVFKETMTGEAPVALQGPGDDSFVVAPASHTWRPAVVARWIFARAWRALGLARRRPRP